MRKLSEGLRFRSIVGSGERYSRAGIGGALPGSEEERTAPKSSAERAQALLPSPRISPKPAESGSCGGSAKVLFGDPKSTTDLYRVVKRPVYQQKLQKLPCRMMVRVNIKTLWPSRWNRSWISWSRDVSYAISRKTRTRKIV